MAKPSRPPRRPLFRRLPSPQPLVVLLWTRSARRVASRRNPQLLLLLQAVRHWTRFVPRGPSPPLRLRLPVVLRWIRSVQRPPSLRLQPHPLQSQKLLLPKTLRNQQHRLLRNLLLQ
jgi:hypothetical protein